MTSAKDAEPSSTWSAVRATVCTAYLGGPLETLVRGANVTYVPPVVLPPCPPEPRRTVPPLRSPYCYGRRLRFPRYGFGWERLS